MPFTPSPRIDRINAVSRRGAFDTKARPDSVSLSMGEPDFDSPSPVIEAMIGALRDGWTHYVPMAGLPQLREAVTATVNARHGTSYTTDNVQITHGGTAGITASILTMVDSGSTVVAADPTYSLYTDAVALAGGNLVSVPVDPDEPDQGALRLGEAAKKHDAALLILCNPGNPTGSVMPADAQLQLSEALVGTNTMVLADEAYQDFVYNDRFSSALDIPALRNRLIYVQTFSKTFAMTGWRVGYVIAPEPIIGAISSIHRTMNGAVNAAAQVAAVTALETQAETVPPMIEEYRERRSLMIEGLSGIPGIEVTAPDGAFYIFLHYSLDIPSEELRRMLSEDYGLELRAGSEYGDNGEYYLRISYAYTREALQQALAIIRQAFTDLAKR